MGSSVLLVKNVKLSGTVSAIYGMSTRNILNFIMDSGVFGEDVFKEMLERKEISPSSSR